MTLVPSGRGSQTESMADENFARALLWEKKKINKTFTKNENRNDTYLFMLCSFYKISELFFYDN